MKIHGTISANLSDAIASAERFQNRPVYAETIGHWNELVREARRIRADQQEAQRAPLDTLIARLEKQIALRSS